MWFQSPSELTIKAIGHQWYWSYEYPDHNISFDSLMVEDKDFKPGRQLRLLETDTHVVVPTNTNIRMITTSADVIHSWAIPSFGVKRDSVPGRLNERWFNVQQEVTMVSALSFVAQSTALCLCSLRPISIDHLVDGDTGQIIAEEMGHRVKRVSESDLSEELLKVEARKLCVPSAGGHRHGSP